MPGMNGMELATAITVKRPRLQVLLMSGFPAGMLVLNEGWHFLPKPFIPSKLRAIVMTLISSDRASKFVEYPSPDKQS
jgi:DNA-binding NtrC family response regulator